MSLLSADQIQRPGDDSFLHSWSGCKGEHLPLWLNHPRIHSEITDFLFNPPQLHYNSKTLKTESPNTSRGSSLPRTLSKESKLYGMKDSSPPIPPNAIQSKTNSLLPPPPPPIPSGTKHSLMSTCMPCNHHTCTYLHLFDDLHQHLKPTNEMHMWCHHLEACEKADSVRVSWLSVTHHGIHKK